MLKPHFFPQNKHGNWKEKQQQQTDSAWAYQLVGNLFISYHITSHHITVFSWST